MQYNPSRYEVDKKTGFFTVGYGYGSSPTFTNLTVTNNGTFGGNLTVTGTGAFGDATGGVFYQASLYSNNQGTGVRLLNNNASSRNWYIGSQNNVGNAVEITPSTANNGTTFSTPVWQISSAGNVTQTGNLTVSGTGLSSVAGGLKAQSIESVGTPASYNTTGGILIAGYAGSSYALVKAYSDGSGTEKALTLQPGSGNLLLGTTTDGGQKLQVAGTGLFSTTEPTITLSSTAVGSIAYQLISGGGSGHTLGAFKIYDSSTGYVVLNHDKPTSGGTRLSFDGAGNATFAGRAILDGANSVLVVKGANPTGVASSTIVDYASGSRIISYGSTTGTASGFSFVGLSSNGSVGGTRFSIDSAGDATFAGNVTVNGTGTQSFKGTIALKAAAVGDGITLRESYAGNSLLFSVLQNSGDGTGATIAGADGAGSTTFSVNTQTGAATFSGAIAIGNTVQTAAAVASTHKVTISIGGSTYYLLATNV